jgi:hypothetical protein
MAGDPLEKRRRGKHLPDGLLTPVEPGSQDLQPDHPRTNREAIHHEGTGFVLNYATLGAEAVMSSLLGREPLIVGEKVELSNISLPTQLAGKILAESSIGPKNRSRRSGRTSPGRLAPTFPQFAPTARRTASPVGAPNLCIRFTPLK